MSGLREHLGADVRRGDVAALTRALDASPDQATASDRDGFTLLHAAAQALQLEIVELLLARGADANALSRGQETPLMYALQKQYQPASGLVAGIERGAFVVRRVPPPPPAERRAAVVRALLAGGARANPPRLDRSRPWKIGHRPPIVAAAELGDVALVELLVFHGARVDRSRGARALAEAARAADRSMVEALLRLGATAKKGGAVLAAVSGCALRILDQKAYGRARERLQEETLAILDMLWHAGASPRERRRGWDALHFAVNDCLELVAAALVARGAKLDGRAVPPQADHPQPILVFAVTCVLNRELHEGAMLPLARLLVRAGADRSATATDGRTAARIAWANGLYRLAWALS